MPLEIDNLVIGVSNWPKIPDDEKTSIDLLQNNAVKPQHFLTLLGLVFREYSSVPVSFYRSYFTETIGRGINNTQAIDSDYMPQATKVNTWLVLEIPADKPIDVASLEKRLRDTWFIECDSRLMHRDLLVVLVESNTFTLMKVELEPESNTIISITVYDYHRAGRSLSGSDNDATAIDFQDIPGYKNIQPFFESLDSGVDGQFQCAIVNIFPKSVKKEKHSMFFDAAFSIMEIINNPSNPKKVQVNEEKIRNLVTEMTSTTLKRLFSALGNGDENNRVIATPQHSLIPPSKKRALGRSPSMIGDKAEAEVREYFDNEFKQIASDFTFICESVLSLVWSARVIRRYMHRSDTITDEQRKSNFMTDEEIFNIRSDAMLLQVPSISPQHVETIVKQCLSSNRFFALPHSVIKTFGMKDDLGKRINWFKCVKIWISHVPNEFTLKAELNEILEEAHKSWEEMRSDDLVDVLDQVQIFDRIAASVFKNFKYKDNQLLKRNVELPSASPEDVCSCFTDCLVGWQSDEYAPFHGKRNHNLSRYIGRVLAARYAGPFINVPEILLSLIDVPTQENLEIMYYGQIVPYFKSIQKLPVSAMPMDTFDDHLAPM